LIERVKSIIIYSRIIRFRSQENKQLIKDLGKADFLEVR
jgi:hypothetical protein